MRHNKGYPESYKKYKQQTCFLWVDFEGESAEWGTETKFICCGLANAMCRFSLMVLCNVEHTWVLVE